MFEMDLKLVALGALAVGEEEMRMSRHRDKFRALFDDNEVSDFCRCAVV